MVAMNSVIPLRESYRALGGHNSESFVIIFIDIYTRQGMYVTLTSLYKKDLVLKIVA